MKMMNVGFGERTSFAAKLQRLIRHCFPAQAIAVHSQQLQTYKPGDLDSLGGIYAVLNAFDLVLAPWGELKPDEAEKCMKIALRHLLDRRPEIETLMLRMSMKRLCGTAKLAGVAMSGLARQVHVEVVPTKLRRSIDQMLDWTEAVWRLICP